MLAPEENSQTPGSSKRDFPSAGLLEELLLKPVVCVKNSDKPAVEVDSSLERLLPDP